jgi:rSAM/selenodomain-associated transferase 1
MIRRTLVIFAKAPALGRVKSRLARGIGQAAALAFYRRTLAEMLRRVARDARWRTIVAVTPDRAARCGRRWPRRLACRAQGDGDLGARMARAFRNLPKGQVVIVGADIPELEATHVARAFAALGEADIVLGPARDGGYWLIGAKGAARDADMFARVRWSTAHALADTRANLNARRVALLDVLDDIDDPQAYARFLRRGGFRGCAAGKD